MKRFLLIVLVLLVVAPLASCNKKKNNPQNEAELSTEIAEEMREKFCSVEEAKSFLIAEEITLDNWEEYFEIKEIEQMKKDPMGEETGYKKAEWYICFKNDRWAINETVTLKFTYKEAEKMEYTNQATGQTRIEERHDGTEFDAREDFVSISSVSDMPKWYKDVMYEWDWWCEENEVNKTTMIIQDFKCEGAKGSVGTYKIPDEAWNVGEDGTRYLLIGSPEGCAQVNEGETLFLNLKNAISVSS